jgi:3-oxoacyl-[acyl-carrier protein] reductase
MFRKDLLKGKVALVVGGSSESGPVVCQVLARYGADVALTYRSKEAKADQVAHECGQHGVRARAFHLDLLALDQVTDLASRVVEALGRLDILVNLGGPPSVYTSIRELDEAGYDRMLDSHLKGCFFLAREAALYMENHDGGTIVNVSATSSLKYSHSAYGLVKACVNEMTRFLAYTFAPKVRIINLIPGMIEIEETDAKLRETRAQESPLKTIVTPEELGLLVVAAASPAFRNVTGESLLADGGFWLLHR